MRKVAIAATSLFAIAATTLGFTTTASASTPSVWTNDAARNAIIKRESGGNPFAVNPYSGTTGLYQCMPSVHSCPALGDVAGQQAWGESYMKSRYGTWENAWAFWQAHNWW